jgi:hypothetical protein
MQKFKPAMKVSTKFMSSKRIKTFGLVLLVAILAGAAWGVYHYITVKAPSHSGVKGVVIVDGGCPFAQSSAPCPDKPLVAKIAVKSPRGNTVATAQSNASGQFQITLAPGWYTITAANITKSALPIAQPQPVTVMSGAFTSITITFDSGVR